MTIRSLLACVITLIASSSSHAQTAAAPDFARWQKVIAETGARDLNLPNSGIKTIGEMLQTVRGAPTAQHAYFYFVATIMDASRPEVGKRLSLENAEKLRALAREVYDYCHVNLYKPSAGSGSPPGPCGGSVFEATYTKLLMSGAWRRSPEAQREDMAEVDRMIDAAAVREPTKGYCVDWMEAFGNELGQMRGDTAEQAARPEFAVTARVLHDRLFAVGDACVPRVPGHYGTLARQRYAVFLFSAFEQRYPARLTGADYKALLENFDRLQLQSIATSKKGGAIGDLALLFVSIGLSEDAQRSEVLAERIASELSQALDADVTRSAVLSCRTATGAFKNLREPYQKAMHAYPRVAAQFEKVCEPGRLKMPD